jgi:hypothetical protein
MENSQSRDGVPGDALPSKAVAGAPPLRATDADRERIASVLQAAMADGRLSMGELEGRLEAVYAARSQGELASVVKDLQPEPVRWAGSVPAPAKDVAVLSSFVRKGRWPVGRSFRGTAVVGTGVIDLREARFTGTETTVHARAVVGNVYVVVPEDAEVHVAGTGIIGGFTQDREEPGVPATQRINVVGVAFCGNVRVVHELPSTVERRLLKRRGPGA